MDGLPPPFGQTSASWRTIRPVIQAPSGGRPGYAAPLSCCLSAAGFRFSVTLSRQGLPPPLTVGLPPRLRIPAPARRTLTRFPRSARVRPGPGRAPSIPRGQRCSLAITKSVAAACRLSTAGPCHPGTISPARSVIVTRHQQGFPGSRPSGPSPHLWPPWLARRPSGFPVSSAPSRSGTGHARHGGDRSNTNP